MPSALEMPEPSCPFVRARIRLCALGAFSLLLAAARAADDDDAAKDAEPPLPQASAELARKYAAITGWQGFFESSESGSVSWSGPDAHGFESVEITAHGQFLLGRSTTWFGEEARRGVLTWSGGDNNTVCGEQIVTAERQSSTWHKDGTGTEMRTQAGGTLPMTATEFAIRLPTAKRTSYMVSVHPGAGLKGRTLPVTITGRNVWNESKGNGTAVQRTRSLDAIERSESFVRWYSPVGDAATAPWHQVVQAGPGVLVFPFESRSRADTQKSTPELTRRSRVILCPVYDDLEVEVTIEGYAKWRPEGSIEKPAEPGNHLVARATLKSKTGKLKVLPEVKRFKFELLETSREPGVCLNWPLRAKDADYDLRLATEGDGKLSDSDQKLEIAEPPDDANGQPYGEVRIDSYDFGGKATLQVVCELEDGREIMGLMKGEGGRGDLVRLPKMDGPDWIADIWRKEKKVEKLGSLSDDEKVAGQDHNGDGFTLYEEYRGWVVNGKHVEGDPERKDFFVLNAIGPDAKGGLALFERVSQLRVHSRLRPSEMLVLSTKQTESVSNAKGERCMNFNHRDAPHRVDQHGVHMIVGRHQGGATVGYDSREGFLRAFRPRYVQNVVVEPRDDPNAILTLNASVSAYNLGERDAAFAYDRGVAHELLHVVGVDHHGEGEDPNTYYFQSANDPNNPTHRARFTPDAAGEAESFLKQYPFGEPRTAEFLKRPRTVTLIWEDTRRDVAESLAAEFERALEAERASRAANPPADDPGGRAARMPYYGKDANYWRETDLFDTIVTRSAKFSLRVTVGKLRQADSGNELCLMRYYFANAYPVRGREDTYYLVRPGPEANRAGRELCTSAPGTQHNASTHEPQPRFGDAAPGRGNCFSQICPNDAIPPRKL